jgi:hypothetical protein
MAKRLQISAVQAQGVGLTMEGDYVIHLRPIPRSALAAERLAMQMQQAQSLPRSIVCARRSVARFQF